MRNLFSAVFVTGNVYDYIPPCHETAANLGSLFSVDKSVCLRVCRFCDSILILSTQNQAKWKRNVLQPCQPLLRLSLEQLVMQWAVLEHGQIRTHRTKIKVCVCMCVCVHALSGCMHFHLWVLMCGHWCDACKKQQMPKHTRGIRCVLKEGLSA